MANSELNIYIFFFLEHLSLMMASCLLNSIEVPVCLAYRLVGLFFGLLYADQLGGICWFSMIRGTEHLMKLFRVKFA